MNIENLSLKLSNKLGDKLNKSKEEKAVLNYGLFVVLHTSIAIVVTFLIGMITGTFIEITIISIVMSSMKRNSGGVHSSSPERCLLTGLILTLMMATLCENLTLILNKYELVITISFLLFISYIVLYKKCPVPSKNKPLKNKETRKRLRKKCFKLYFLYTLVIIILYASYIFTNYQLLKILIISIVLGLLLQIIALTNLGKYIIDLFEGLFNLFRIN